MADASNQPPIIIKKIKKGGHGHHGGAWKVAYADFVTAMMAFFLLLWLLSTASEDQKEGIAEYFTPSSINFGQGASNGVMGGQSVLTEGSMVSELRPTGVTIPLPGAPEVDQDESDREFEESIDQKALEEAIAAREEEQFAVAEAELKQAIQEMPELKDMADSLKIDRTPEGLRIQMVDQDGRSMFASGSAVLVPAAQKLHELVAQVIVKMPNQISVRGHTDATPYRGAGGYSNWDLSADRANASRRALTGNGVPMQRISDVIGKAATDPLLPEEPGSAQNRRISIVLLRDAIAPSAEAPERQAAKAEAESRGASDQRIEIMPEPEERIGAPSRALAPFRPGLE